MNDPWAYLDLNNKDLSNDDRERRIRFKRTMDTCYRTGRYMCFLCATLAIITNFALQKYLTLDAIKNNPIIMAAWPMNKSIIDGYTQTGFVDRGDFKSSIAAYIVSNDIITIIFITWICFVFLISITRQINVKQKVSNKKYFTTVLIYIIILIVSFYNIPTESKSIYAPSYQELPLVSSFKESILLIMTYFSCGPLLIDTISRIQFLLGRTAAS